MYFTSIAPPVVKTGSRIRASGLLATNQAPDNSTINNTMVVSYWTLISEFQSKGQIEYLIKKVSAVSGDRKVAVILINFQDLTISNSHDYYRKLVFTNSDSTNAYYKETSDNKLSLVGARRIDGDIYGPYTIQAKSTDPCDYRAWARKALDLSKSDRDGVSYDHVIYLWQLTPSCDWGGLGEVGGYQTYINAPSNSISLEDTITHELGHNFGVHHASSLTCSAGSSNVAISSTCTIDDTWTNDEKKANGIQEYGDPFDVMGDAFRRPWPFQFNNFHTTQAGWISSGTVETVTTSGDYDFLSTKSTSGGTTSLRIPRSGTNQYYYLEYRRPSGQFDSFGSGDAVVNGISIRLAPDFSFKKPSYLLDNNPTTATFNDAALGVGKTFDDGNVQITTLRLHGDIGASVRILFRGTSLPPTPPPPGPTPPTPPQPGPPPPPSPAPVSGSCEAYYQDPGFDGTCQFTCTANFYVGVKATAAINSYDPVGGRAICGSVDGTCSGTGNCARGLGKTSTSSNSGLCSRTTTTTRYINCGGESSFNPWE